MTAFPVTNGRALTQFKPGNDGGPGNPHIKSLAQWRELYAGIVTSKVMAEAIDQLLLAMRGGEQWAIVYMIDRGLGKMAADPQTLQSVQIMLVERDRLPKRDDGDS